MEVSILSDWVTQIIIFILIGTILELVIPNNSMKRYIHIVVGLILLLILVKPILYIFSVHVPTTIDKVEQTLFTDDELLFTTEKQIESQKNEIHKGQDAYIWSEVTSQLIYEGNAVLKDEYSEITISDISFETKDENEEANEENIETVIVTLSNEENDNTEIRTIQPVEIGDNERDTSNVESDVGNEIKQTLAQLWGIDEEKIEYIWGEGEN